MSRGFGKLQRALLDALEENETVGLREASVGLTTTDLAHRVFSVRRDPYFSLLKRSQRVAVYRALTGLAKAGLVIGFRSLGHERDVRWRRSLTRRPDR
jgi:hypothetical protein